MKRFALRAAASAAVTAIALPLAIFGATAASAQPAPLWDDATTARIVVPFTAAELHSAPGAHAVAARIRIAADKACGGENLVVRMGTRFGSCKAAAIARALDDLNAPLVAQAMGRQPPPTLAAR